jgi:hypothetical protein
LSSIAEIVDEVLEIEKVSRTVRELENAAMFFPPAHADDAFAPRETRREAPRIEYRRKAIWPKGAG